MKEPAYKREKRNAFTVLCILAAVMLLMAVVAYDGVRLKAKLDGYEVRKQQLNEQIEDEKERTESLKEFKTYTKTKKFVEEIAESKIGLVHDGERIYKTTE